MHAHCSHMHACEELDITDCVTPCVVFPMEYGIHGSLAYCCCYRVVLIIRLLHYVQDCKYEQHCEAIAI